MKSPFWMFKNQLKREPAHEHKQKVIKKFFNSN